jgi:tetratricopeptide (TPR) repeat protein
MTRWLGWSVLAAGVMAAGYLAALNPAPVELLVAPARPVHLPLGVVLSGAMAVGALAVGTAAGLAGLRRLLSALGARRQARLEARRERRAELGPDDASDRGDLPAAIDAAESALRAQPESPWLLRRVRDLYARAERWPEALSATERLVVRLRTPELLEEELRALRALRYEVALAEPDADTGARALLVLAREDPLFAAAWMSAGDRLLEAGRRLRARRAWVRGTKHRAAPVLLARLEAHDAGEGRPGRTTRLYRRLRDRHPEDRTLHLLFVRHLLRIHATDEAAALLDSSLDATLGSPVAEALRGEVARRQGDFDRAAAALAHALGPGLGLGGAWTCVACGTDAPAWAVRCGRCRRWNALQSTARPGLEPQDSLR